MNSNISFVVIVQERCRRAFFYSENNNHYPHSSFIQTTSSTVIWSQTTCSLYPFLKKEVMWEQNYLILERPRFLSMQTLEQSKLGLLRSLYQKYLHFFFTIPFNFSFLFRSSAEMNMGRNVMFTRLGWRRGQSTLKNILSLMSNQSSCCTAKLSTASDHNSVQTATWTTSSKSVGIMYLIYFVSLCFVLFYFKKSNILKI